MEADQSSPTTGARATLSQFDVRSLVVVITGGGTGIGKAAAHALVAAGAKTVFILGRRGDVLQQCQDSAARPDAVVPIICDVTCKESIAKASEQVRRDAGYCDLLFANAGIPEIPRQTLDRSSVESVQKALWDTDMTMYEKIFRVNTLGAYYTAIAFLGLLAEGNRRAEVPQKSQIIMTSSVTGQSAASFGVFGYPASKAALCLIAKQLAGILLPFKIRINVIVAGIYMSEMTQGMLSMISKSDPCKEGAIASTYIPLERAGNESDIAGLILFLASKAGAYISGAEMVTDGGMLSVPPPWTIPEPPAWDRVTPHGPG